MRIFTLQREKHIERPLDDVFSFFADAHNLERLTPPWLHFRILTPGKIDMAQGTLIDYQIRLHGIPVRWQSEITEWHPPHRFIDAQQRGPYRMWVHEHTFREEAGGTNVRDTVRYAVWGGRLVQRLFIAPDLDRIFSFREDRLTEVFSR
jgi:ligand-binding SRPBCC domain-containing protein